MAIYEISEVSFVGYLPESDWLDDYKENLDECKYLIPVTASHPNATIIFNIVRFFNQVPDVSIDPLTEEDECYSMLQKYCDPIQVSYLGPIINGHYLVTLKEVPVITYDVLAYYAGYLVNGDPQGLSEWELGEISAAIEREGVDFSLASYEFDAGFGLCELTGGRGDLMQFTIRA